MILLISRLRENDDLIFILMSLWKKIHFILQFVEAIFWFRVIEDNHFVDIWLRLVNQESHLYPNNAES